MVGVWTFLPQLSITPIWVTAVQDGGSGSVAMHSNVCRLLNIFTGGVHIVW